jgi:hypothetical protein
MGGSTPNYCPRPERKQQRPDCKNNFKWREQRNLAQEIHLVKNGGKMDEKKNL